MHPSTPKYARLIEIIKSDIQQGILTPEQKLPNEDEIAEQHAMSRGTVRKAIAELQNMGLVRKEQGRGTFVNEPKAALNGFSLAELDGYIQANNHSPETQTLLFDTIIATQFLAEKLDIEPGTEVIHLVQLRLSSGMPIVYEERYFANALCPDITQNIVEQHPIHWLLIEKYQIPLLRLAHTIEIGTLPEEKFKLFGVEETVPVFIVDRLSYTQTDGDIHPAVWYQALYRADEYQFQAQFHTSI